MLLATCLCARPSRLSACWQCRGFVNEMKQGDAFAGSLDYFWMPSHPTMLYSSTHYLHLQGIYKVPSARWEWQRVIREQLKRQVLRSFHLCLLCVSVHLHWSLRWCFNNEVNGLQWHHRSLIMNWSFGSQMPNIRSASERLCPRNSLNHKHIGLTGHQLLLLLPYPELNPAPRHLLTLSSTHSQEKTAVQWDVIIN